MFEQLRAMIALATLYEVVMPIYQIENVPEEFVTPTHSTADGRSPCVMGTQRFVIALAQRIWRISMPL